MILFLFFIGALAVLGALYAMERRRGAAAASQLAEARARLEELESGPQALEYRIEQFDLLWFPVVTWSPREQAVLKTAAGVPHCKACAAAMKSKDGGKLWSCEPCRKEAPGSVTDVAVMDQVVKLALKHFAQRHPGVKLPT